MRQTAFRFRPNVFAAAAIILLATTSTAAAQAERDFSGTWKLDRERSSNVEGTFVNAQTSFRAEQSASSLILTGDPEGTVSVYPLDRRSQKYRTGNLQENTATKWEGGALLVNTIVSGPEDFSIAERWSRSRDGNSLTIERSVVRKSGETQAVLVYYNSRGPAPAPQALVPRPAPAPQAGDSQFVVAAGTHILLRLTNAVNTKHTKAGTHIYLETGVPVFVNGRLIIPVGSYVNGTVIDAKQAGRVKGKSSLTLEYDSLTLRSGVTRNLRSRPDSVDTKGDLDKSEGTITGDGNKAGDAGRVAETTAAGTGVGAIAGGAAGHLGMGAGIGAAGGAVAGLASVFGSRGPEVVLPAGTTMDMVLDRDLRYSGEELHARVQ